MVMLAQVQAQVTLVLEGMVVVAMQMIALVVVVFYQPVLMA
jgi:hypothetical protein